MPSGGEAIEEPFYLCYTGDGFYGGGVVMIVVIGGGPAGMMAAGMAGRGQQEVLLVEKNPILGRKLRLTGKGRCNLTNATDISGLIQHMTRNGSFLYSSLHRFSSPDLVAFFHHLGLATKVERGGRVFPVSDDASQVADVLASFLAQSQVQVKKNCVVEKILASPEGVEGVLLKGGTRIPAQAVILATGGLAYPGTGSTGDGYRIAQDLGHHITPLRPSLVPIQVKDWIHPLKGLKLKNVGLQLVDGEGQTCYQGLGEVHFLAESLAGPLILTASAVVGEVKGKNYQAVIDLKPGLEEKLLHQRIQRDFLQYSNRNLSNALVDLLPRSLQEPVIERSGIPGEKKVHQITRQERQQLVHALKRFSFSLVELGPFSQAIVTAGGVALQEVSPSTMESKQVPGLFFAGEILDVDGLTGGFNLQLAFSTGYVAGTSAS